MQPDTDTSSSAKALGLALAVLLVAGTALFLLVVAVWRPDGFWLAALVAAVVWGLLVGGA